MKAIMSSPTPWYESEGATVPAPATDKPISPQRAVYPSKETIRMAF